MARKKSVKYTYAEAIEKIKTMGIRSLTLQELKEVGRPLMRVARERIRRLEKAGLRSPAYIGYKEDLGMKTSVNFKDRNKVLSEVYNAYIFLEQSKTSTVREARAYKKRMEERLGTNLTDDQTEAIWDVFHRIEKTDPLMFQKFGYEQVIHMAVNSANEEDFDVDKATKRLLDEVSLRSTAEDYMTEDEKRFSLWSPNLSRREL